MTSFIYVIYVYLHTNNFVGSFINNLISRYRLSLQLKIRIQEKIDRLIEIMIVF
jgi:hypothetical protein